MLKINVMIDQEKAENKQKQKNKEKYSVKDYFQFNEVLGYFFRKKDPERPTNFNLRMMHGINKISIIVFLLAMIFFIAKHIF